MRVVPRNLRDQLVFYKLHLESWLANAGQIGISEADALSMAELVEQAQAAYVDQREKQNAARSATIGMYEAQEKMNALGSSILLRVGAQAKLAGNGVYATASIPVPKKRSPAGPPGKPTEFKIKLQSDGVLHLSWKCDNPANTRGTIYYVRRQIGTGEMTQIAIVGKKKFIDNTLPKGASTVTYQVQAARSKHLGEIAEYIVNFAFSGPRPQSIPKGGLQQLKAA